MKYIILGFVILVFAIVVLCFVIKAMKNKNEKIEKELESSVKQNEINASYNKEIKQNEEKLAEISNGNKLDNFNSGIELLRKQAAKGKERNRNNNS